MMDYYGSIVKSEVEIDTELINKFRSHCYESYIRTIISDLRKEGVLEKEYSVSGWYVFGAKLIYEIFEKQLSYKKHKCEKKIKFLFCSTQLFTDYDVLRNICDRI